MTNDPEQAHVRHVTTVLTTTGSAEARQENPYYDGTREGSQTNTRLGRSHAV